MTETITVRFTPSRVPSLAWESGCSASTVSTARSRGLRPSGSAAWPQLSARGKASRTRWPV